MPNINNPIGSFGFLPWMRRGLAARISDVYTSDILALQTLERAKIGVDVKASNNQIAHKDIQLIGPGDILGLSTDAIIRTEPVDGSFNLEKNYFPFIEFYEEDFPWRYTPAVANNDRRLAPWLALIVLKDDECNIQPPTGEGLPMLVEINAGIDLKTIFHPHTEHWAWAHVHVNKLAVDANAVIDALAQDPDSVCARLMCPRRLEANTQYTAFLVPAFETGRLAGLGLATDNTKALEPSWHVPLGGPVDNIIPGNPGTDDHKFPFYYKWRFGTAALGDFESLAKALKPQALEASLGGRKMDLTQSGMGFNSLFAPANNPAVSEKTVILEGALQPPTFQPDTAQNVGYINANGNALSAYTQKLVDLLNISADIQETNFSMKENPFIDGVGFKPTTVALPSPPYTNDDPVILPPMYGQWHADQKSIAASSPKWFQELNLDTRYRASAGLGIEVVRKNQEAYMELAWQQIGEVLLANNRINKGKLAMETSKNVLQKHFIGEVSDPSVNSDTKVTQLLKRAAPMMKKILLPSSNFPLLSGKIAAGKSTVTGAAIDSGFRKLTRNRAKPVSKMGSEVVNDKLVSRINAETVAAATLKINDPVTNPGYALTPQLAAQYANNYPQYAPIWNHYWNSINLVNYTAAVYLSRENHAASPPAPLYNNGNVTGFIQGVITSVDPSLGITNRVTGSINIQNNNVAVTTGLKPIMAYPVIDKPMVEDLMDISTEYLLPNMEQYPNNSVTLLQTNRRFMESYMAGLNHEFSKELLWREYPTDQRGTYFRRFWDYNDVATTNQATDFLYDIEQMHLWSTIQSIGNNPGNNTINAQLPPSFIVLVIKGDLLRKYPNTLIYAQVAAFNNNNGHSLVPWDDPTDMSYFRFPVFKKSLQPDVTMVAFNLTVSEAKGDNLNPGWFFVFRERPGQVRFGLDEFATNINSPLTSWDDLSWDHMVNNNILLQTARVTEDTSVVNSFIQNFNAQQVVQNANTQMVWGTHAANKSNAASVANITLQKPAMVAIHAGNMLL